MARYRKLPVEIEAVQYTGANGPEVGAFLGDPGWSGVINTLEGDMTASPGDWVVKGVRGEFYPVKPDIFAATYEPVT